MSEREPKVSVGMPVYNGERFLEAAIQSVLAQTCHDLELVISDNASTDGTEAICRHYAASDARVRYERNTENRGASWNYSRVVHAARGEYFKWAACDDLCHPELLERCIQRLEDDRSAVLCFPRCAFIDQDGNQLGEILASLGERGLDSPSPAARYHAALRHLVWCSEMYGVARSEALRKTRLMGPFAGAEKVVLVELALIGRFVQTPHILFFFRQHETQYSEMSTGDQATWMTGKKTRPWAVPRLVRNYWEYAKMVPRARISASQKLLCSWALLLYLLQLKKWPRVVRETFFGAGTKGP
ncbi:MAG: glycosyltransferase family 2 protein [Planctomycetes bacterium]|nr:glycosyltransferase family 2 protein [Planctomycetota bacterium]